MFINDFLCIFEGMKGKVVIVTGCSSGIGKALVYAFAGMGSNLVMASRNEEKLKSIAVELSAGNVSVIPVVADVSKEDDCRRIIATAIEHFGKIDILINNAGISMRAAFIDLDLNVIRKLMDTNFWGTVYCTKYALPHILKNKGSVVGVSSIAGFQGLPGRTGYSASKFAIHGFLETLRIEHLHEHLHVMIACPGFTSTDIRKTALNKDGHIQGESPRDESKMMTAEEVAHIIIRGIKRKRRTLIMTSKGKLIVFLNKMIPWFMDIQTYKTMAKEPNSPIK
jgi:dehydrogenase/reductase SDR family member 7B